MNISFLPDKIKSELGPISEKISVSAARAYGSIEGDSGECYLISRMGKLLVFSRKAGEDSFRRLSGMFGKEISKIDIRQDKFSTFLDIIIGGITYSVKFSSSEHKELETLVESLKSHVPASEPAVVKQEESAASYQSQPEIGSSKTAAPASTAGVKSNLSALTPLECLAAAMMYITSCDKKISEEEDRYILEIFRDNKPVLGTALAYYKSHAYDDFLGNIAPLHQNQKLCILANMVEIAMRDSVLQRSEQECLRKFIEAGGVKDDQYQAIRSVLYVKNWTGVLDE